MITAIVHVDKEWGIGKGNDMMFSLPKDMKFFRETTSGHTVVMGGNTLRSLPNQRPLKNRVNIVLSRGQVCDECVHVKDFEELKKEFRYFIKQKRGMLAKGRLLGVQFDALFTDNLYYEISRHAILMAEKLKEMLAKKGYRFFLDSRRASDRCFDCRLQHSFDENASYEDELSARVL